MATRAAKEPFDTPDAGAKPDDGPYVIVVGDQDQVVLPHHLVGADAVVFDASVIRNIRVSELFHPTFEQLRNEVVHSLPTIAPLPIDAAAGLVAYERMFTEFRVAYVALQEALRPLSDLALSFAGIGEHLGVLVVGDPGPHNLARELSAAFMAGLEGIDDVVTTDAAGTPPAAAVDEAREAGRRFVAAQRWAQLVGDRVDTSTLRERLGISRQALKQRVDAGTLLAVPGSNTSWYPTWQFQEVKSSGQLEVRPVVAQLLQRFRDRLGSDVRPLTIIGWAATEQPELDGQSPRDWIGGGGDDEPVLAAAGRAAAELAR